MTHAKPNRATKFQSTLPTRGSDLVEFFVLAGSNISIHAPHEGERPGLTGGTVTAVAISIHAPHEGERPYAQQRNGKQHCISIHAPHEGERPMPRS